MASPEFDPNQPFERVKPPAFDPSQPFDNEEQISNNNLKGAGIAGLEHVGYGASLGYSPQLNAVASKVTDAVTDPAGDLDIAKKGFTIQAKPQSYTDLRDENIARLKQQEAEFPKASLAGTLLGGAATSVVLGPALGRLPGYEALAGAKAAKDAGFIAKSAALARRAAGAAYGAGVLGGVMNPGDVAGELSPGQPMERVKNAEISGILGGLTHLGAEGVSSVGGGIRDWFKNLANERATRAIGLDKRSATNLLKNKGPEAIQDLGASALDEGLISPFATPSKIAPKAEILKDKVGQEIGSLMTTADSAGAAPIATQDLAKEISSRADIQGLKKIPGAEGIANKVDGFLEALSKNGEISLEAAHKLRVGIDQQINYAKAIPEMKGAQQYLYQIRDALNKKIQDSIASSPMGEAAKKALLEANQRYGALKSISGIATNKAAANAANRAIGLTDTIMGAGGASAGAAIGGALDGPEGAKRGAFIGGFLGGGANKLSRTYGPALTANLASKFASVVNVAPQLAGALQKNPALIPILANSLIDKSGSSGDNNSQDIKLGKRKALERRITGR